MDFTNTLQGGRIQGNFFQLEKMKLFSFAVSTIVVCHGALDHRNGGCIVFASTVIQVYLLLKVDVSKAVTVRIKNPYRGCDTVNSSEG